MHHTLINMGLKGIFPFFTGTYLKPLCPMQHLSPTPLSSTVRNKAISPSDGRIGPVLYFRPCYISVWGALRPLQTGTFLCHYAVMPLVSGKILVMFCAEYAQNASWWHSKDQYNIKKPFHNALKLDLKISASPLLKFPDIRESQSEGLKLTSTLKKRPLSLKNCHKKPLHTRRKAK